MCILDVKSSSFTPLKDNVHSFTTERIQTDMAYSEALGKSRCLTSVILDNGLLLEKKRTTMADVPHAMIAGNIRKIYPRIRSNKVYV
jgi:hypothetical protein